MARGKYAHSSSGVKLPVVLIFLVIAIIAVIFAVTALVRVMGIEPTLSAWKAEALPLNYTRKISRHL